MYPACPDSAHHWCEVGVQSMVKKHCRNKLILFSQVEAAASTAILQECIDYDILYAAQMELIPNL